MDISRRDFLKVSFVTGSSLVIAIYLEACGEEPVPESTPTATKIIPTPSDTPTTTPTPTSTPTPKPPVLLTPSMYVTISDDGKVTITQHRSEMGQGVRTALPMILADELGADWNLVHVEQALANARFGDQRTGGSRSVATCYTALRMAGASARQILINAASQTWNVQPADCYTENSLVIHRPTGKQLPFGDLIALASTLPIPPLGEIKVKDPAEFRLIGTNKSRVDNPEILSGRAVYGMDVSLPGMLYAVVARCPVIGGKVRSYDDSAARQVPGVREVVQIENGIAVVAEGTWQAMRGKSLLQMEWDQESSSAINSADIERSLLEKAKFTTSAADELVQYYTFSFYAHATMEPMNCTVDIRPDGCDAWVPTQDPQAALNDIAALIGMSNQKIKVHVPLIGCGCGRRIEGGPAGHPPSVDYVREAVQIAQVIGAPIHLVWTRQDDFEHDMFHPLGVTRVRARLDNIKTLSLEEFTGSGRIPIGFWRSVTNPPAAFARESFLDEYALATEKDPVELRRNYLMPRAMAVVDKVAEMASWGSSLPAGTARGIAHFATWSTTNVAQVAEVMVSGTGIRVPRVYCAVDCGIAINPDMVVAQMESGIVFGLTAALKEAMLIENGTPMKNNFLEYPILRFDEMPQVEVEIIPSSDPPTGIGEMSNPVIAPAVANAVFALTGQRLRKMPLRLV